MGRYPQLTVPSNAELKVNVGFFKGATGSDGVTFEVQFEEGQSRQTIVSRFATYDGKLDSITQSLSSLAGRTGYFILYVNAGQSSGQDWAAWAEAKIETAPPALPDLVVVDVRQENNTIRYKIKNVGESSVVNPLGGTISFCNALFIDGELVAKDYVNIYEMMPGQWIDNPFDYYWEMTPPQHTIKVCADWEQNVDEENEGNNWLEETWYMEEELPDLIIDEIKCDRENSRIEYVLKNIGQKTAKGGHSTTLFVDGKEVTHDLVNVDLTPGETYESWFKEYKWTECHTIEVRTCTDNYNQVKEANEQNNCLDETCECVVDTIPPTITSGPTVSEVTQTSTVICWETDEASDSRVKYDNRSGKYGSVIEDPSLVKQHCLNLTKLEPTTTYHFMVESRDSSRNGVISRALNFAGTWDTSTSEKGSYHVLGLVIYDGQTTPPITVIVSTNYSPVADLSCSPDRPDINQDITFDASGSSDRDGEIVSFQWDFGDGSSASGKITNHAYSRFNEYEVILTVTDNEGAFDTSTRFVTVAAPVVTGEHPRWDINEDGKVDYKDLAILGAHYGDTTEPPYPRYDINQDGRVDLYDRNLLVGHYKEVGP